VCFAEGAEREALGANGARANGADGVGGARYDARVHARVMGLAVALSIAACDDDGGRLLVAIGTDFVVPSEMAVVRVRVTGPEGAEELRSFQLAAPGGGATALFEMPLSFIVEPRDGNSSRTARILVEGFARSETDPQPLVVARRNVSGFVEGRTSLLPIFLRRTCSGVMCPDEQTCELGACSPAAVDSRSLPAVTSPGEERRVLDDLADASAPDAGARDGGATDAGSRDAALGDAGPVAAPDASVAVAHAYGDGAEQHGWAVAVFSDGDLVVAGSYTSMLSGTSAAPAVMGKDAFVARISPSGAVEWIHTLNGNGDEEFRSVVLQGIAEEVVVAGYTDSTSGAWPFTAGVITPGIVVAKFGAMGELGYGGVLPMDVAFATTEGLSVGPALAAGPNETFLAWAGTGLSIAGTTIGAPAARRAFVAALHPEGAGVPGDSVPQVDAAIELPTAPIDAYESQLSAVAASGGEVYVGGYEAGALGRHAYVAGLTYDAMGPAFSLRWQTPDFLDAGSNCETRALALGPATVYAAGIAAGDAEDGFLVAFGSTSGSPTVLSVFGGPHEQFVYALARDSDGRLWTAGGFYTAIGIATPVGFSAGASAGKDVFLACFASNGTPLSAWAFAGGDGDEVIRALALPWAGEGYFVGDVSLGVTFPGLSPIGMGSTDAFFGTFGY